LPPDSVLIPMSATTAADSRFLFGSEPARVASSDSIHLPARPRWWLERTLR
jgi:hypothetical protein